MHKGGKESPGLLLILAVTVNFVIIKNVYLCDL